jgi:hypothetical protein
MPRLDLPFGRDGPIIDVGIWIAAELGKSWAATGSAIPEPFVVSGLVDTGARVTAIGVSIIAWMGIPSIGVMEASSSLLGGEARSVPIFPLRMTFGPLLAVLECPLSSARTHGYVQRKRPAQAKG